MHDSKEVVYSEHNRKSKSENLNMYFLPPRKVWTTKRVWIVVLCVIRRKLNGQRGFRRGRKAAVLSIASSTMLIVMRPEFCALLLDWSKGQIINITSTSSTNKPSPHRVHVREIRKHSNDLVRKAWSRFEHFFLKMDFASANDFETRVAKHWIILTYSFG